jgi:pimeloyl-ACP methyl ester carboxylesterase
VESTLTSPVIPDVAERFVHLDGARMRYLQAGAGPTLVLLHGLLGYSFSWRKNLAALAQTHTVYAPDQLCAGFSDRVPNLDCRMEAIADRTLRFLDLVGIKEVSLLGSSHGGSVAVLVAARLVVQQPGRLQRLVLVAPANPWSQHGRRLAPLLSRRFPAACVRYLLPRARFAHPWVLSRLYGDPKRITPGTLEGYLRALLVPGTVEYGLQAITTWCADLEIMAKALPQLADLPTLLLWGTRDAAVDPQSALPFNQYFRRSRLIQFDGVGHLPYEELPDEFNRAVLEFLNRTT